MIRLIHLHNTIIWRNFCLFPPQTSSPPENKTVSVEATYSMDKHCSWGQFSLIRSMLTGQARRQTPAPKGAGCRTDRQPMPLEGPVQPPQPPGTDTSLCEELSPQALLPAPRWGGGDGGWDRHQHTQPPPSRQPYFLRKPG